MTDLATQELRVVMPEYRLSPKNSIDDMVNDAIKAIDWAYNVLNTKFDRLCIGGDSAGGGLALLTLLKLMKMEHKNKPVAGVLVSPWLDFTFSGGSITRNKNKEPLIRKELLDFFASNLNTSGQSLKDSSPLFHNLTKMVPLLIQASDIELLLDDSLRLNKTLESLNIKTRLQVGKCQPHIFPVFSRYTTDGYNAIKEIGEFVYNYASYYGKMDNYNAWEFKEFKS